MRSVCRRLLRCHSYKSDPLEVLQAIGRLPRTVFGAYESAGIQTNPKTDVARQTFLWEVIVYDSVTNIVYFVTKLRLRLLILQAHRRQQLIIVVLITVTSRKVG